MSMSMVNIGKMVVAVSGLCMLVGVNVFAHSIPFKVMGVLVVLIMRMGVLMFLGFMLMLVFVLFREVQPDAHSHQQRSHPELKAR